MCYRFAHIVALNLYYLISFKSLHFLFRPISFAAPSHVVILERKRRISWGGNGRVRHLDVKVALIKKAVPWRRRLNQNRIKYG